MIYSKLFPMGTDEADDFIQRIAIEGSLNRIEPERFPYKKEARLLYFGPHGFMTVEKKPKEGKWEVTIET